MSHTICIENADFWYSMNFDAVYCFSQIVIIQSHDNDNANRMDGTKVNVVNSDTETQSLCGVLQVKMDGTLEAQTYRIPCNLKCGDKVRLDQPNGNCIHMKEIMAFQKPGLTYALFCSMSFIAQLI